MAGKVAIANLGGPVKKRKKMKVNEGKGDILSYNNSYFYHSFIITITTKKNEKELTIRNSDVFRMLLKR